MPIWVMVFLFVVGVYSRSASAGYLKAWGDNYWGQCDVPEGNFIAIAAGNVHSLALTPEPATLLLLGLGAVMLRKRKSS